MQIINFQEEKEKLEKEKREKRENLERIKDTYFQDRRNDLPAYLQTRSGEYKGVLETPVLTQCLPRGEGFQVLGQYDPMSHSITYGIDLPIAEREHVRRHEIVHSYGFRDENQTDSIASKPDYEAYSRESDHHACAA